MMEKTVCEERTDPLLLTSQVYAVDTSDPFNHPRKAVGMAKRRYVKDYPVNIGDAVAKKLGHDNETVYVVVSQKP
jgi:hypothetical protein